MYRSWGAIWLALAVAGCASVDNGPVADPAAKLNETTFRCKVEPILARQCSFNACHGNAGSPLRIYTPGKLRASPPANIDEAIAPLTDAEQHANFESAAGFNYGIATVDDNWLLRKPLTPAEGGYSHKGGVIFTGGGDPQYATIRAWLTGALSCI
jgi:hypothetical protein